MGSSLLFVLVQNKSTHISVISEYAGNIGDAKDEEAREAEQDKILQLVERFTS